MTATINNNTVPQNIKERLLIMLRMADPNETSNYNSMTPTTLEFLAYYEDAVKKQEFQIDASGTGGRPIVYAPAYQA